MEGIEDEYCIKKLTKKYILQAFKDIARGLRDLCLLPLRIALL